MGMLPITIRKRTITEADLELIQTTVREYWHKGRTQISEILCKKWKDNGGRDRSTARLTLGVGLAVSAFPLSVPV